MKDNEKILQDLKHEVDGMEDGLNFISTKRSLIIGVLGCISIFLLLILNYDKFLPIVFVILGWVYGRVKFKDGMHQGLDIGFRRGFDEGREKGKK